MKVESESEVAQLCPTPSDPMDCSLPGSSVHGIFQARVLEWSDLYSFNHVGIYLFCQRFTGAGKPAHWLLGKLMATRKDAVS